MANPEGNYSSIWHDAQQRRSQLHPMHNDIEKWTVMPPPFGSKQRTGAYQHSESNREDDEILLWNTLRDIGVDKLLFCACLLSLHAMWSFEGGCELFSFCRNVISQMNQSWMLIEYSWQILSRAFNDFRWYFSWVLALKFVENCVWIEHNFCPRGVRWDIRGELQSV